MYSSTIKPTRNDLKGKGKQWKGDIGATETVVAGLISRDRAQNEVGKTLSSKCWAISFTTDWVVVVLCDGDSDSLLSYVAARRAENIGMSVLEHVESHSSAQSMDVHLASYLASDGILAMNVSKLAKDEIQNGGGAEDARQKGQVRGELFSLHKDGLQMGVGVVCIDRATYQAVVWKCGDVDVLYRSTPSNTLQSLFSVPSKSWSSKDGIQGTAQFLMCTDVAQISMRTSNAGNIQSIVRETVVPDEEFQEICVDDDIAWVTWCAHSIVDESPYAYTVSPVPDQLADTISVDDTKNKSVATEETLLPSGEQMESTKDTSAREKPIEILEQQALQGREFTQNVRLAEENSHGFFYLGNKYISIVDLKTIFDDDTYGSDTKGLCLANCSLIDDECIEYLAQLKYIRHLDLRNTGVTVKGLYSLAKFKNLKYLDLSKTAIRTGDIAGVVFPAGMRLNIDA